MKKTISLISLLSIILSSCCSTKECTDGSVKVIPFFNGVYQIPAIPVKDYYIIVNRDPKMKLHYYNELFPSPIDCKSDLPMLRLDCCREYTFELYVTFYNNGDLRLDSSTIKIFPQKDCLILDADLHFPK